MSEKDIRLVGRPEGASPDFVRLALMAALAEAYSGVEYEPLPEPLLEALRELERLEREEKA